MSGDAPAIEYWKLGPGIPSIIVQALGVAHLANETDKNKNNKRTRTCGGCPEGSQSRFHEQQTLRWQIERASLIGRKGAAGYHLLYRCVRFKRALVSR